jgi:hypothetical protein
MFYPRARQENVVEELLHLMAGRKQSARQEVARNKIFQRSHLSDLLSSARSHILKFTEFLQSTIH